MNTRDTQKARSVQLPVTGLTWARDVEPLVIRQDDQPVGEVRMLHDGKTLWVLAHSLIHHGTTPGALQPKGHLVGGDPLAAGDTIVVLLQAQGAPGAEKDELVPFDAGGTGRSVDADRRQAHRGTLTLLMPRLRSRR